MAIDKLIPQYLNSDTDQKLVKSVEMTDNLNVRISNDDEGTAGVVKNIKGTTVVAAKTSSDAYPSGDNRVVGSVANERNKEILFLLWNSNQNHGIYRLDMTSGKYQKLYEDSVLNFLRFSYVDCGVVVNEDGETLMYWTDNENPPMKVNINRLISGDYPDSLNNGTDEEKLLNLTVAKKPPLTSPTLELKRDSSLATSNIDDSLYQFAYKYVYIDGEHSALSPYSEINVSPAQYKWYFTDDGGRNYYNKIEVSVLNTVSDVKEIVLFARNGSTGTFYEVDKIKNNFTDSISKIGFTNSKIGRALSNDELNKNYDNVPQLAKSMAITGQRLMYGNYTEGYENIDTNVDITSNYEAVEDFINITIESEVHTLNGTPFQFKIDFANIPSSASTDTKIYLNYYHDIDNATIGEINGTQIADTAVDLTVAYRDVNDSTNNQTESHQITNIIGGIKALMGNILVREVIDIPAGTSKVGIIQKVQDVLNGKRVYSIVNPKNLELDGYSNVNGVGKSARFTGTMELDISFMGSGIGNDEEYYGLKPKSLEIKVADFFKSAGKKVDIVSSGTEVLDLTENRFGSQDGVLSASNSIRNFGSFYGDDFKSGRSFKSGSSHMLGIVYADDRGRTSGVQEIGDFYVKHLNDRSSENSLHGKSSAVLRISHNPPAWAKKWIPVYNYRAANELKLFYGVQGAFVPRNNDEQFANPAFEKKIYVSLNNLFQKEESFTKSLGASIDYKFEEGDRLRIVRFSESGRTKLEFEVLEFRTLTEDRVTNPILNTASKRTKRATTGEFLILKDNDSATNFNTDAILKDSSKWFDNCIIEIYRKRKQLQENVYYEFGKCYDITNSKHVGENTATSFNGTIDEEAKYDNDRLLSTTTKIFKGDTVTTGTSNLTIGNVWYDNGKYYAYYTDNATVITDGSYLFNIVSKGEAIVQITEGDIHFRPQAFYVAQEQPDLGGRNLNDFAAFVDYTESYSVSDFFNSKLDSRGRPFAHIPDAKTIRRTSSITYSDAFVMDSDRLNLSSFNLSLANWIDLDISYGGVTSLVPRGDALTAIQENKSSQIPIGRNLIEYANGDAGVTVSRRVLGTPSYYAGEFGTSNPESVVERFGVVYFVDAKAGKVIRLSADGITPISEKGLDSFFENKFKSLLSISKKVRVIGGFDPDNNEYLVTVEPVFNSQLTIGSDVNTITVDADSEFTIQGVTYTSHTVLWNIWGNIWNIFCGDWDDVGNGVVYVDSLFNTQSILVDSVFLGSTDTIKVLVTDSSYSFSAIADLNLSNGQITLPSTTCAGDNITISDATEEEAGFTVAYKHKKGIWSSKYSFKPTMYVNINNELYSFFDTSSGVMWKHNVNDTRNNFYGTQYDSVIEVVSNRNPSMVKVYEAIGIEGGGTWSGKLTTSDQSTTIGTSDFDTREGHRYAMIYRDTLKSTGHQIYLGKVDSVSTDKVTFTTPINRLPFVVGDILKTASGSTLTGTGMEISGITDRKTIQCTTNITGISAGDNVFVEHTARIEGDAMRDVFLKIKLTSSDTSAFEVHAVSLSYDRSKLHNDRVN